jgi:predicted transcriptional regulator
MDAKKRKVGIKVAKAKQVHGEEEKTYKRPSWVKSGEEELCPDCFKVVGERSRYNLVCMLGKAKEGMTVGKLTDKMKLRQPTVTHHLKVLRSVDAVECEERGRERIYTLNRDAHCFEECKIPYE